MRVALKLPALRFIRFILPLLALLLTAACAAPEPTALPATATPIPIPTSPAAKVLTLRYWQAPSLPLPYLSGGDKDWDAAAITLEPLAYIDPEGNLQPALAAEIPTRENGGVAADGRAITWRLQPGVKWSDGSDFTAADVVFTWRYCTAPGSGCTAIDAFAAVAAVEALDTLSVKITFAEPAPWPYTPFVGSRMPILNQSQFAQCLGAAAAGCAAENAAPLGTGPYRITDFTANDQARYERNPYYRGPEPWFDRVELRGGGDALSAAQAVLAAGTADYAWNLQIRPETLAELESRGEGRVAVAFGSFVERLAVNQTNPDPALGENRSEYQDGQNPHPFLTFPPIRQAMSMAIDRSGIAEMLYGFAAAPECNVVAGPPAYRSTANDACRVQDIAAANRLLDEPGVLDTDDDGIREYRGAPLKITLQTSANEIRQETQQRLREGWQQIGIETTLVQHDAARFFGGDPAADPDASYRRFFADVQMYADNSGIDPERYFSDQLCGSIPTRANRWAGGNIPRSCNPEYDRLFAQLAQTPAGPQRADLVRELNDRHIQSYYEIPLVNRGLVSAYGNTLQGVRPNAWDTSLWNIAEWRR